MNNIILVIIEFFKTGLFAVGGGLATVPFLFEMSEKYGWFSNLELSTMIAISESTPGPMGINMATYVGYHVSGIIGALAATLSLVAPSIIVICIIANFFTKFRNSKLVKMIFEGIRPAVIAFIFGACFSLFVSTLLNINSTTFINFFNYKNLILLAILLLINFKFKDIHPIFLILFAALVGIIFKF